MNRGVGTLDRRGYVAVLQVDRGDQQHRRVHRSGDRHRQHDVQAGDSQQSAPVLALVGMSVPVESQTGMQIHRVRHHGGAQDGGGQQHAFRCRGIAAPGR